MKNISFHIGGQVVVGICYAYSFPLFCWFLCLILCCVKWTCAQCARAQCAIEASINGNEKHRYSH